MATLSRVKIILLVILFLTFLQYLYLYPVKLNLSAITKFNNPINSSVVSATSLPDLSRSLFYFKTASNKNSKRSFSSFVKDDFGKSAATESNLRILYKTSSPNIKSLGSVSPLPSSVSSTIKPMNSSTDNLPYCPSKPSTLLGYSRVNLSSAPSLAAIGRIHSDLSLGGHYSPPNCTSKDKVAIIIPFRDREEHLRIFLFNLIPVLKRQQVEFNIFVVEQGGASKDEPFNRAMLFNVGFVEANKRGTYDCFIFHDVDLIPENDYNMYNCPVQPRHMSVAVDKMKYRLIYKTLFGGVSALTKAHFEKINGFSNSFWGWGGEDDDMSGRIAYNGLFISRPPPNVARYKMLKHKHQKLNNQRYRILQKGKTRFKTDGLSNLKYTVEQLVLEKTYTLVRVQLAKV